MYNLADILSSLSLKDIDKLNYELSNLDLTSYAYIKFNVGVTNGITMVLWEFFNDINIDDVDDTYEVLVPSEEVLDIISQA